MPAKNRVIYNQQALYVSSTATGYHFSSGSSGSNLVSQLHRIQSASHEFSIPRTDVNQYGQLAAISREVIEAPSVTLNFSYLLTNGVNEKRMGLVIDGATSAISGILSKASDEKNYFVLTAGQGSDAANDADANRVNHNVYAFGNGFLSSYSIEAAVGSFPTANVTVEALNVNYNSNSSGNAIPGIIAESGTAITDKLYTLPTATSGVAGMPTALRYGDITAVVPNIIGATTQGNGGAHIQSCTIDVPLSREPLNRLGSRFAFSREIQFPVTVSATITANVSDLTTGKLVDLISSCGSSTNDLSLTMRECATAGSTGPIAMKYTLKNATLNSESFDGSIGPSETVTLTFSSQIGAANDTVNGLFISGSYVGS